VACAKVEAELSELDRRRALELLQSYVRNESGLANSLRRLYDSWSSDPFFHGRTQGGAAPGPYRMGETAPRRPARFTRTFKDDQAESCLLFEDLVAAGSMAAVEAAAKRAVEGKEYVNARRRRGRVRVGV